MSVPNMICLRTEARKQLLVGLCLCVRMLDIVRFDSDFFFCMLLSNSTTAAREADESQISLEVGGRCVLPTEFPCAEMTHVYLYLNFFRMSEFRQ